MWKKAVPAVVMCSFLLVGCNTNKTVPTKNETPMQDIREGVDRVNPNLTTPEVNTPSPGTYNKGMNGTNDTNGMNGTNGTNGMNGVNGNKGVNNVGPNVVPDGEVMNETTVPNTDVIKEDVKVKTK
ncbi:hypothetical protein PB01_03495 [Psychrobacillus glaciei]|uniref:Collagen-like protein n=1 Tax=Psychrobacillus glaciei TaxID=2283160 RepID=A0A5J6SMF0_9BACI|nr:hypothetical protein [Psychrobacillus glaciei]QFF97954.1 hypothetical protein PB01_03495 [Psychrobacillus glaciei]